MDLISRTKLTYLRYYISGNFAFWLGSVSAECFIHLGSLGLSQFWSVSLNIETASEIKYFNKFEELFQQEHEHYLQIVRTLNNAMNTLKTYLHYIRSSFQLIARHICKPFLVLSSLDLCVLFL